MFRVRHRQNEEDMLRIQYAARYCFNRAEKLNDFAWLLCILSVFTVFIPNSVPEVWQLGIPAAIDFVALLCDWRLSANVSLAASLRKYFDAYVLDIGSDAFDRDTKQRLFECAHKIERKNPRKAKTQMTHSGYDDPPGVKDWYELSETISPEDEAYECQRQNCWWNNNLARSRLRYSVIFSFLVVVIVICIHVLFELSLLKTVFCCSPIVIQIFGRVVVNIWYILISYKIDGIVENLSDNRTEENVLKLQTLIDERRGIPVLEKNWFHRRWAKAYSEGMKKTNEFSQK